MILAIDLCNSYTNIAYIKYDYPDEMILASIRRDLGLESGQFIASNLTAHFLHIHKEYISPTSSIPSIINVALPNCITIKTRHLICQALANLYDKATINLIPQPAAALIGYNSIPDNETLTGDILVINTLESPGYFSFLSFNSNTGEITIENQSPLPPILNEMTLATIISEAKKIGLYKKYWQLANILLFSNHTEEYSFLQESFKPLPIIKGTENNIINGLVHLAQHNFLYIINIIYPNDFYIEKYNPEEETTYLELIPFASEVLELDIAKQYTIATLPLNSNYNLSPLDNEVLFKIYAIERGNPLPSTTNYYGEKFALHYSLDNINITGNIDIILDLHNSELKATHSNMLNNLGLEIPFPQVEFNQDWLLFTKSTPFPISFHDDWQDFINNTSLDMELSLEDQLQLIKYKLLTLLAHIS